MRPTWSAKRWNTAGRKGDTGCPNALGSAQLLRERVDLVADAVRDRTQPLERRVDRPAPLAALRPVARSKLLPLS
jgi:hypothetical protein